MLWQAEGWGDQASAAQAALSCGLLAPGGRASPPLASQGLRDLPLFLCAEECRVGEKAYGVTMPAPKVVSSQARWLGQ